MAKKTKTDKITNGNEHVERIIKLQGKKGPIDIDQYFGKVNFGIDGLEYQLKIRNDY